ncbi:thiamine pyrophosphate-binding protein [Dongia deserti]|uniref:thiamine pyrophosphate-binding protein n=1 Tax=Dongia deserti TaxID=2268030 RepID=UPI0025474FAF|nr:thiamine pyrophosphate-binding protein [Dongia deserti]
MARWFDTVAAVLKRNEVRLVTYVPDKVLAPLIRALEADSYFTTFCPTREEEAAGIVCGGWMGGMRGIVLMQTSGFATLANVLASLALPYRIPLLMMISERGTLGEFNVGQAMVCRSMRPMLTALGIEHHTLSRRDEIDFIVDRTVNQAIATQEPAAFILSPLLTHAKRQEA